MISGEENCRQHLGLMILHIQTPYNIHPYLLRTILLLTCCDLVYKVLSSSSYVTIRDLYLQVWLSRMDGHMGLANSLAMKMAGISRDTKDPDGGTIVRTSDGGKDSTLFY